MKIKYGNVENFYKMYNEMQGVSFKVRKKRMVKEYRFIILLIILKFYFL